MYIYIYTHTHNRKENFRDTPNCTPGTQTHNMLKCYISISTAPIFTFLASSICCDIMYKCCNLITN